MTTNHGVIRMDPTNPDDPELPDLGELSDLKLKASQFLEEMQVDPEVKRDDENHRAAKELCNKMESAIKYIEWADFMIKSLRVENYNVTQRAIRAESHVGRLTMREIETMQS